MTFQEFNARFSYNPQTDRIGKGGFASVFKAFDTVNNKFVALKVFDKQEGHSLSRYDLLAEKNKTTSLMHPNICRYEDLFEFTTKDEMGLEFTRQICVLEYADQGSLKDYIAGLREQGTSELEIQKILRPLFIQILSGLEYLHQNKVIHRDINAKNIVLCKVGNDLIAKITDFGISRTLDGDVSISNTDIGTPSHQAPDAYNEEKYGITNPKSRKRRIGFNADLWSFGVMAFELLTGKGLFNQVEPSLERKEVQKSKSQSSLSKEAIMTAVLQKDLEPSFNLVSEPFRSVLRLCLVRDAEKRTNSEQSLIDFLSGKNTNFISSDKTVWIIPEEPKNKMVGYIAVGVLVFLIALAFYWNMSKEEDPLPHSDPYEDVVDSIAAKETQGNPVVEVQTPPNEKPKTTPSSSEKSIETTSELPPPSNNELYETGKRLFNNRQYKEAFETFDKCSSDKCKIAKVCLIMDDFLPKYFTNSKDEVSFLEKALLPAAKGGNVTASTLLGMVYYDWGSSAKCNEALKYLKAAAEHNDGYAFVNLGNYYSDGGCVGENESEAVKWYKRAVNYNEPEGYSGLANYVESVADHSELLEKAYELGEEMAPCLIAQSISYGGFVGNKHSNDFYMQKAKQLNCHNPNKVDFNEVTSKFNKCDLYCRYVR